MNKSISFLTGILTLIVFHNCRNTPSDKIGDLAFNIDPGANKETIDLKLSDLIESCFIVQLETTDESILEDFIRSISIGAEYIIIDNNSGINIFDINGKFINRLKTGRGPDELSISHSLYYSENEDLLFINNRFINKDKLLCYDIKSQTYRPPIKKCFSGEWNDFIIYEDSLILGSLDIMDAGSNPYAVFVQNFDGRFKFGIKSNRKFTPRNSQEEILQRMLLYYDYNNVHLKYTFDDTLFSFKENQLYPYLTIHNNSPKNNIPKMNPEIGVSRVNLGKFENPYFMIFKNLTYEGLVPMRNGTQKAEYDTTYVFLNKLIGKYGLISSFEDDFIEKYQDKSKVTLDLPLLLPNDRLCIIYRPSDLLKKHTQIIANHRYPTSLVERMNSILSTIKETDNPILLLGKSKKKIAIP